MAQGYLKAPPPRPLPSPLSVPQLLRVITMQLEGIANTLHDISHAMAVDDQVRDWEMRERLGLPHNTKGP